MDNHRRYQETGIRDFWISWDTYTALKQPRSLTQGVLGSMRLDSSIYTEHFMNRKPIYELMIGDYALARANRAILIMKIPVFGAKDKARMINQCTANNPILCRFL